ncbi:5-oxoprolinase subunit PxpB [Pseudoteredinibacter isoporae]|uniref:KipI family sensor histidine kinase inhibitor n=1 Tax=Pseudoteredinibacter isoporae TaxID=570281 RepID=A0A7X0MWG0_9GAMM|nr:5-oxoprolinase subunit PxpB [Pseudoteredinibacter isoporae]MBB6520894.1 KipI family sensor histidine kinase inhibitor [Pseudoteredinibacter isoporae]NHO86459.1 5-oxoprolinase subunit PxpB [Pseudoteredinibacter isoporae]NIB25089.1 5-oxoprolinase subunit PxpB [Pseudoteredinibacter isoporae]
MSNSFTPRIEIAGADALIVYLGAETRAEISAEVQKLAQGLQNHIGQELVDLVPSYASLLIIFNPLQCDHLWLRQQIRQCLSGEQSHHQGESRLVELPSYYSRESGPDLSLLAQNAGLSEEEVVALHSGEEYRVYAIGFAPGFAYLGQVDQKIAAPRLATPRKKVPKGAVAIADRQTAVYPAVSPGGWNLIGLCPSPMFDPQQEPHMPVAVGDRIRFRPISREEFLDLGGELPEFEV